MDINQIVEKWIEHCNAVGHTTQSDAFDKGLNVNLKKYATYEMPLSGCAWIRCGLPGCGWKYSAPASATKN